MSSERYLIVLLNGSPVLEFDRSQPLSDAQKESLQLMDEKLDRGVSIGEKFYANPTVEQRVEFVAANLFSALFNEKEVLAAASCAYIAISLSELKQIKAIEEKGMVSIELIFDREYQHEVKMNYSPIDKISTQH